LAERAKRNILQNQQERMNETDLKLKFLIAVALGNIEQVRRLLSSVSAEAEKRGFLMCCRSRARGSDGLHS
jgi:hypothetical protein